MFDALDVAQEDFHSAPAWDRVDQLALALLEMDPSGEVAAELTMLWQTYQCHAEEGSDRRIPREIVAYIEVYLHNYEETMLACMRASDED
jgi:hypothetical protein